jgi:hypothetical protein
MTEEQLLEIRKFGTEVADSCFAYFSSKQGDIVPFVCGIDVLIATALAWLRGTTGWSRDDIEEALRDRVKISCDIAFGPKEAKKLN